MTRRELEALSLENRRLAVLLAAMLAAFGLVVSLGGCRRPAALELEAPAPAPAAPEDLEDLEDLEAPPVCTGPECLPPAPR